MSYRIVMAAVRNRRGAEMVGYFSFMSVQVVSLRISTSNPSSESYTLAPGYGISQIGISGRRNRPSDYVFS